MKVYIVIEGWVYEGESILGVFKDKETAQIYIDHLKPLDSKSCYRDIDEYEVQ